MVSDWLWYNNYGVMWLFYERCLKHPHILLTIIFLQVIQYIMEYVEQLETSILLYIYSLLDYNYNISYSLIVNIKFKILELKYWFFSPSINEKM